MEALSYIAYFAIGLGTALFIAGMLWRRTAHDRSQRGRLLVLGLGLVVFWLPVGLLALVDKQRTIRDYIDQWLFPVESASDSGITNSD